MHVAQYYHGYDKILNTTFFIQVPQAPPRHPALVVSAHLDTRGSVVTQYIHCLQVPQARPRHLAAVV